MPHTREGLFLFLHRTESSLIDKRRIVFFAAVDTFVENGTDLFDSIIAVISKERQLFPKELLSDSGHTPPVQTHLKDTPHPDTFVRVGCKHTVFYPVWQEVE